MKIKLSFRKYYIDFFIILVGLIFGGFLMQSSFSSDNGSIFVSTKSWSDFASHIPLIRSFSFGQNFPPEYPLFPGAPINYHFLFYAFVGFLEKVGLPIGLALNIPSIFGFTLLTYIIYLFSKLIFKSKSIGFLSVVFFLFNSSLSFVLFFQQNPISIHSINEIITNNNFVSFAPYGDGIISAFWNHNIFTNQRHLAFSLGLSLSIIYFLIKPIFINKKTNLKLSLLLGVVLGLSFFLHLAVLLMSGVIILILGILFSKIRLSALILLITAVVIAFPQYLYISSNQGYSPEIVFGYLVSNNLSLYTFAKFWIYNIGLSVVFIPLGFIFANKNQKKIFISFFSLFLIGNIIQFSPEIAANHKFFNYFLIIGNMFSAFILIKAWNKNNLLKPLVIIFAFLMIFGGIVDFFPLFNDGKYELKDISSNPDAAWIQKNTPANSVFLNTTYLYNPASLAGRKIFLGWPYFAWSQGYDTTKRGDIMRRILGSKDKFQACTLLKQNNIDYLEIEIQNPPDPDIPPISDLFEKEFIPNYSSKNNYKIYSTRYICN